MDKSSFNWLGLQVSPCLPYRGLIHTTGIEVDASISCSRKAFGRRAKGEREEERKGKRDKNEREGRIDGKKERGGGMKGEEETEE